MLKAQLFEAIDRNSKQLVDLVNTLTPEQLLLRPEGKWSVLEQLEHIALTDKIVGLLLMRPHSSIAETETVMGQARLEKIIVTLRARKVAAPDLLQPTGSIQTAEQFTTQFTEQRTAFKAAVNDGTIVLDSRTFKHPYLGEMTVIDWYHFIPLHAQRHLEQIKDILGN
jgi:hypothetical protein